MLSEIREIHFAMAAHQYDDHRGERLPFWFNVVTTCTALILIVAGR
jgi:hypothetical protein